MAGFIDRDFKVKLGLILGAKLREHKKINSALSKRIHNRDSFDQLAVI